MCFFKYFLMLQIVITFVNIIHSVMHQIDKYFPADQAYKFSRIYNIVDNIVC